MKRNTNFSQLSERYLFTEIVARKTQFIEKNPEAHVLSLSVGDTSQPLIPPIASRLASFSQEMGTHEGYRGYGPEEGILELRKAIAQTLYQGRFSPDEIFVSDGAGCDIGRLQILFGSDVSVAVPDPSYPSYLDGSLIQGVKNVKLLPCTRENNFFPEWSERTDLLYLCFPNNPTGKTATREELQRLVAFAKKNRSLILFDAAYCAYVQDKTYPRSIFDIEGADEVAIEIGSFSKMAGFTGVRAGWTVVPEKLKYDDGSSVRQDWMRVVTTLFNGASIVSQKGALTALASLPELNQQMGFYLENTARLKKALSKRYEVFGGECIPYIWARTPGQNSWDAFQELLETLHIVAIPGSGFGPSGEGYLRFSGFGPRQVIEKALQRLA